jgi:transcriptional regulator with XRE-family HTH domain
MLHIGRELRRKNITNKEFADVLGVSEKTVVNKLSGQTEFTYSEIKKARTVFPEFTPEYLFDTDTSTASPAKETA